MTGTPGGDGDPGIGYADGAEDAVLATLRAARDVSTTSVELATRLDTPELAYHFSAQRVGLLAPLAVRPGQRVVDLGCGSGVLTRALAEAGATVLGVEGEPARAAAARERCRDLDGVEIVEGRNEDAIADRGPFDVAVLCGVLEYSTRFGDGPDALLRAVVEELAPGGVLLVAIENRLGLGYLLGRDEDHLGRPWAGLAGYPGPGPRPRTWNRSGLSALLAGAGLPGQRWLLPYPDYKLPRAILDADVFDRPDAPELVDKLVRDPLLGAFGGPGTAVAARPAHQRAVADGAGPALASSFLVLAGRTSRDVEKASRPGLGWLVTRSRRPELRRERLLRDGPDGLELATTLGEGGPAGEWLRQQVVATEAIVPGVGLDALLLDALADGEPGPIAELLGRWWTRCTAEARPLEDTDVRHPYLPGRAGVPVLPADCLDVHPGNLIVTAAGYTVQIDLEWQAGTGVDAELAGLRALHEFVREMRQSGAAHPWPAGTTVRDLVRHLAEPVGLGPAARNRWDELLAAEGVLQELVTGRPADLIVRQLAEDGDAPGPARPWEGPGPRATAGGLRELAELRDHATELRDHAAGLERAAAAHREHAAQLENELAAQHARVTELVAEQHRETERVRRALAAVRDETRALDGRLGVALSELAAAEQERVDAERDLATARADADRSRGELTGTRGRLAALESSSVVRAGRRYLWPAARMARGVRDLALGRGGADPDEVLRRAGNVAPALAGLLAARVRGTRRDEREAGLYYSMPVPGEPVFAGGGQVVELVGWVVHAAVPVRSVAVRARGRTHRAVLGRARPDVVASLARDGVAAPLGCGVRVRLLLGSTTVGRVPLELTVTLVDGTVLRRTLPELEVRPGSGSWPVRTPWPGGARTTGPKVAICLATYNPDRYMLVQQLDSIRAQTHRNWVCVLCDDASTPDHRALLTELTGDDPRFVVATHDRNVGFYRNFERALRYTPADADAVALADQDDVWDDDKLAVLLDRLAEPGVALAYSDMRLIDGQNRPLADTVWPDRVNHDIGLESLLLLNAVTGAASLVDAGLVAKRVLPFPPGNIAAYHDQWLAATAQAAGRIAFVPRPLHSYRQHGGNVTGWQAPDLAAGLPGPLGTALLAAGVTGELSDVKLGELDVVAEHERARIAQFATVLLLRNNDVLRPGDRDRLVRLALAERGLAPLVDLLFDAGRRPETAGAEHRLLASALLAGARQRRDRRLPSPS